MPKQKTNKKYFSSLQAFLDKKPIVGYILLTLSMMSLILLMEKSADFYRASILQIPKFDGTVLPVHDVPDWTKNGGKNIRAYNTYSRSELMSLPDYNPKKLEQECGENESSYKNACITYSTVYMGNYQMDHKEYAGSHLAIDIRVPSGTPIYAVANGVIETVVQKNTGFGHYVVIKHPDAPLINGGKDTLYSAYAHLSEVLVESGSIIKKGDLLGYSGDTGVSTTPHMHFQVDTSSAPYHPWWPFSSAQVSSAGLSFFEGINSGLGQAEAMKNTVNPMLWVQKFKDNSVNIPKEEDSTNTSHNISTDSKQEVGKILLKADSEEIKLGESVTIFITILDQERKVFTNYIGLDFHLTASNDIVLPDPSFREGKAEITLTPQTSGIMNLTLRDGDKANTIKINVLEDKKVTPEVLEKTDVEIPENVENKNAISDVIISTDESFLFVGRKAKITVTALNADGEKIQNPEFDDDLAVSIKGFGRGDPNVLKSRYFTDGVAKMNFYADESPGKAEVFLEKFPDKKVTFEVVDSIEEVSSFAILTDGGFAVGKREVITFHTLDSNGKITPKSFNGTAEITLESGTAKLSKTKLTSGDFTDGTATIEITPIKNENIALKIKSGVLVGFSKTLREKKEAEKIFSDISSDHPNAKAITLLKKKNILEGNPDGSFRPDYTINRAEFAKVILLALNISPEPSTGKRFPDVPKDAWFAEYVETAAKYDLIKGYPDGSFGPANSINRAELFTMLDRAEKNVAKSNSNFSDVPEGAWFKDAADFASSNNLLDFEKSFLPGKAMSRAEVAESVSRFLLL